MSIVQLAHPKVAQPNQEAFRPQVYLCWTMSARVKGNSKSMPLAFRVTRQTVKSTIQKSKNVNGAANPPESGTAKVGGFYWTMSARVKANSQLMQLTLRVTCQTVKSTIRQVLFLFYFFYFFFFWLIITRSGRLAGIRGFV